MLFTTGSKIQVVYSNCKRSGPRKHSVGYIVGQEVLPSYHHLDCNIIITKVLFTRFGNEPKKRLELKTVRVFSPKVKSLELKSNIHPKTVLKRVKKYVQGSKNRACLLRPLVESNSTKDAAYLLAIAKSAYCNKLDYDLSHVDKDQIDLFKYLLSDEISTLHALTKLFKISKYRELYFTFDLHATTDTNKYLKVANTIKLIENRDIRNRLDNILKGFSPYVNQELQDCIILNYSLQYLYNQKAAEFIMRAAGDKDKLFRFYNQYKKLLYSL